MLQEIKVLLGWGLLGELKTRSKGLRESISGVEHLMGEGLWNPLQTGDTRCVLHMFYTIN